MSISINIIINILLLSTIFYLQAQDWQWKQPQAGSNFLYGVASVSNGVWVVAGETGSIFRTSDNGITWTQSFNPVGNATISAITFVNSQIGYAVSQTHYFNNVSKIIKSTNGGISWFQTAELEFFINPDRIQFFSSDTGYVFGPNGQIRKTFNGGLTWSEDIFISGDTYTDVYFASLNVGYAVAVSGNIYKTTNGGTSWGLQTTTESGLQTIHFANQNIGYAAGNFGKIYKTTNGGSNWTLSYNTNDASTFLSISSSPQNVNYVTAVGMFGIVYESTNGGSSWNFYGVPNATQDYDFYSVNYYNNNNAMAVGYWGNIYLLSSSGWNLVQDYKRYNIQSVKFINNNKGFAVDNKGGIHETTNGGNSWLRFQVPFFENKWFSTVVYSNPNSIFALGPHDTLLYTHDGGLNWWKGVMPDECFGILNAHFPNERVGYAVGYSGTIIKTTNGGANWFKLNTSLNFDISSVFFLNETTGFIGSIWTGLWKTTNGGNNWTLVNSSAVQEITFPNSQYGYAACYPGWFLRTSDGGNTWQELTGPNTNCDGLVFTTENTGYYVGNGIYKTTNGGLTWSDEKAGIGFMDQTIFDIVAKPNGYLYAVGGRGAFLQSNLPQQLLPGVTLRIIDVYGSPGDSVTVSVKLENPFRRFIYHTEQNIIYNPSNFTYTGIDITNTIINNYGWNYTPSVSTDTLRIVNFGNTYSDTAGILYKINFNISENGSGTNALQLVNTQFNRGIIPVNFINGSIIITGLDSVTIAILDTIGFSGDTVTVSVKITNPSNRQLTSTNIAITGYNSIVNYVGTDTTNTLLGQKNWTITSFGTEDGFYLFGNGAAITENGIFFKIKLYAGPTSTGSDTVRFFTAEFNSNTIPVIKRNGLLTINDPIPVELTSFTVNSNGKNVILNWTTATEKNNMGFEIQRTSPQPPPSQGGGSTPLAGGGGWEVVGFINGNGTTTEFNNYSFTDKILSGKYSYRLKQIDFDGSFQYSNIVEIEIRLPQEFSLLQNYPNPFNPSTTIEFNLPSPLKGEGSGVRFVSLKVYDILGNEVATLVNEVKEAGNYSVNFNAAGLPSGVYFYELISGNFKATKKLMIMK